MNEADMPSLSSRSPTLVKNMISGLSYGTLNASYQVVDWSPTSALQPRHLPSSSLASEESLPHPLWQRHGAQGREVGIDRQWSLLPWLVPVLRGGSSVSLEGNTSSPGSPQS